MMTSLSFLDESGGGGGGGSRIIGFGNTPAPKSSTTSEAGVSRLPVAKDKHHSVV